MNFLIIYTFLKIGDAFDAKSLTFKINDKKLAGERLGESIEGE